MNDLFVKNEKTKNAHSVNKQNSLTPDEQDDSIEEIITPEESEAEARAEKKYGQLVNGQSPNPMAIAYFLSMVLPTLIYIGSEKSFYRRNTATGRYECVSEALLITEFLDYIIGFFRRKKDLSMAHKFTPALAKHLLVLIKPHCLKDNFFKRKPGEIILHLLNCFLVRRPGEKDFTQYPLDTEWIHSRYQLPVAYDPQATAPRFMNDLLRPVLNPDEIEVLLKYASQILLGYNISEKILMLIGDAGSGKSITVNLLEGFCGRENTTQLRTDRLNGAFETNRYINKVLLCGKDVPMNFMAAKGAYMLKALTGYDSVGTEAKHSNEVGCVVGNFIVIITSNCNQPIVLNDDRDAWARRVLIVFFRKKKQIKAIPEFDKVLLKEEGSGIFNELLKRLKQILADGGHIDVGESQKQAIADLLDESESVKVFLQNCVECVTPADGESQRKCPENLTTEELYLHYQAYCKTRKWQPIIARKFQQQMTDLMPQLFQRFRRNDIVRNETNHRGYYAVKFK